MNRGLDVDVLLKMFGHHYGDQCFLQLGSLTLGFLCEFVVFVTVFTKTHHLWQRKPETKMLR